MIWRVIEVLFLLAFVTVVAMTVVLASRNRPPRPRSRRPDPYRVRGRSLASWQRSVIREIRRAGRAHGQRRR